MKKLIFLTALLALITLGSHSYAQELEAYPCENGKWGYMDMKTGTMVISCKYDVACIFSEGLALVKLNRKWGYIDKTGKEITSFKYDDADHFFEGLAIVGIGEYPNSKRGYIDKTGKEVIPLKYDGVGGFSEGLFLIALNDKWGYIDKTGKEVISCKYDYAGWFSEGLALVKLDDKWGFIDKTGKEVISLKYDDIESIIGFHEGLVAVKLNDKWGYIDKTGKEVIPLKYSNTGYYLFEGLAWVSLNGKYGYIDKTGKEVIPLKYDGAWKFSEGLAQVKLNNKYGFIDKTGKEVIPLKYEEELDGFFEGLSKIKLNNKYGFIDKTGKEVIPLKYDYSREVYEGLANVAWSFSEGLALVELNDKWGYIDKTGKVVVPIEYGTGDEAREVINNNIKAIDDIKKTSFGNFAKDYVESKINAWQQKGEFEKTADWQQRVNETTRQAKAAELFKDAERAYISEYSNDFNVGYMTLDAYDADNEVYLIKNSIYGDWLVPVPASEARTFKNCWRHFIEKTPAYGISNDQLTIAEMTFTTLIGKTYKYSNQASLNYQVAQIDYNFAPINITQPKQTQPQGDQKITTVNLTSGKKSDVAINIPTTNIRNDKTFALIIANEDYNYVSPVMYAKNDGETFKQYCIKTLGLPEGNVTFKPNATLGVMRTEIKQIKNLAETYNGEAKIIFYYAGHGFPDEETKSAYLIPIDGNGNDKESGYKLEKLYKELGEASVKSVTVFLDACFSGAQRSGAMLVEARGVAIKPQTATPMGNMVVFSAADGDETALPYTEKEHGMFTYFLLKKLQETKGDVTLDELNAYITDNVRRESQRINRKKQTPTVIPADAMSDSWRGMKLK